MAKERRKAGERIMTWERQQWLRHRQSLICQ
jgi:hypothetical protein